VLPSRPMWDAYLCLLTAVLVWASSYFVMQVALVSFTPLALTALRLLLSTAFMGAYARCAGVPLAVRRGDVWPLLGLGFLLNTAFQVCLNFALAFTTPAHASLAVGFMPIFAAVGARLLLHERVTPRRALAILMAFAGVALVIVPGGGAGKAPHPILGDLLALGVAASWALGSVLTKPFLSRYSPLQFTVLTLAGGAALGVPPTIVSLARTEWGSVAKTSWLALLYLSFLSMGVCWLLWNRAIARLEVSQVAIFSNMPPVITLLLATVLTGERPTVALLAGGAMVVAGAFLTQRT